MSRNGNGPQDWLRNSKYNWLITWGIRPTKPGVAHLARKGLDFTCEAASFAGIVYKAAAAMGMKATLAVFTDVYPHQVVFTFYRPDAMQLPNLKAYGIVKSLRGIK